MQVNRRSEDAPSSRPGAAGGEERPCCASGLQKLLSPQLFKALGDPRRVSLLIRLAEEGHPCTVGQLAEGSGVDLSVVSRHLAALREVGVIKCEKQGKEVWCTVRTGAVAQVLRDLAGALERCCPDGECRPESTEAPAPQTARRPSPQQT